MLGVLRNTVKYQGIMGVPVCLEMPGDNLTSIATATSAAFPNSHKTTITEQKPQTAAMASEESSATF